MKSVQFLRVGRLAISTGLPYNQTCMRVVGLDPGSRRIGVALSDELGLTAQPRTTVSRGSDEETLDRLVEALDGDQPDVVVIGLPLRLDGSEGGAARKARELAKIVDVRFGVPVELWDERLTTVEAERVLRAAGMRGRGRTGLVDRVAAAIMLQSYLDAHRGGVREDEP